VASKAQERMTVFLSASKVAPASTELKDAIFHEVENLNDDEGIPLSPEAAISAFKRFPGELNPSDNWSF
jgi:hypothetical protein